MQTLRQTISNIRGIDKLLSSDVLISDRLIAQELRNAANLIVTQQTSKRKLWQSPNVFTPIPCLEMTEVPLSECCEYTSNKKVAKSKYPLPQIGEGTFGLCIQMVTGLDNSRKFVEVTPMRYANLLKLNLPDNKIYYWIQNKHLYVSNPSTKAVNLFAYFTEDIPNYILYPECECSVPPSITDRCINPLDKPFYFPADRLLDIEGIVLKNLRGYFDNKKQDVTSDNKPDNG